MKNIEWNLEKLTNEFEGVKQNFNSFIESNIDDEIFTRAQKFYLEKFEAINDKRGVKFLFSYHGLIDLELKQQALELLNALNRVKNLNEFFGMDINKFPNLSMFVKASWIVFMVIDKHIEELIDGIYSEYLGECAFHLSLNKHLTIEQAHTLVSKHISIKGNGFYAYDFATLLFLYARFYDQKETNSEFYELLTLGLDIDRFKGLK